MAKATAVIEKGSVFDIEGKREWVITPEPDQYIVCLEMDPQQQKVFGSDTDRVAFILEVSEDESAGIVAVLEIGEDNQQTKELLTQYPEVYPQDVADAIGPLETRMHTLVMDFLEVVPHEELVAHYSENMAETTLRAIFH